MDFNKIIQAIVSLIVLALWAFVTAAPLVIDIKIDLPIESDTLNMAVAMVLGFWVGSSSGSARKDSVIADLSSRDDGL